MILKDDAWDRFEPNLVGARAQKIEQKDTDA
jgi:hypothetical protein